jgi:sigma-B regulation protein RsbU (phosphoserine phosphatase)
MLQASKRPVVQYVCLAVVCVVAVAYQVRSMEYRFPRWFGQTDAPMWPFRAYGDDNSLSFSIAYLHASAKQAGLHEGDILLAVNGKPMTGKAVWGEAIARAKTGDTVTVTVTSKKGVPPRTATIRLAPFEANTRGPLPVVLFVVLPIFCLLLGFWVAAVRPRDVRAWLLLALMLNFAVFFDGGVEFWAPWARDMAEAYRSAGQNTWEIWILLLGIYFPEPFPPARRRAWWMWLAWTLIPPLAFFALVFVASAVGEMENYAAIFFLHGLLARFVWIGSVVSYGAIAGFIACIIAKSGKAASPDARRRLRLLCVGTLLSFTPLSILFIAAQVKGVNREEYFPDWLNLASYFMFFLFPVTLAYVIVVHRALDMRVVIRQGLQYAFASGGIVVLRVAILGGVAAGVYSLSRHMGDRSALTTLIIAVGVGVAIVLGKLLRRLKAWTDRRFFRDAYNAEQILSDLGDKVRSLLDATALFKTVSERIAESLHVNQVAVLVNGSGPYRTAYAVGYNSAPAVMFPETAATVRRLQGAGEPARVYLDDPDSWVYRAPEATDEERAQLAALGAELLLPIGVRDKLLGFISLGQKRSEEPYSSLDMRLLKSVATQTGLALENARLTAAIADEVAQRERLNRELEIAREVQERLFPQNLPAIAGLDYGGYCRPALGVGGDYYDFLQLPGGKLGIAVGDVSGKGISAALMMASLQASLRGQTFDGPDDLVRLMSRVNRLVYEASSANRYATFFYAQYDPATRQLSYVNGGHNAPIIFRPNGGGWQVLRLNQGGPVVGLLAQYACQQATITLAPGDVMLAYTDGVSESMNASDEEWGEERMMEAAESCAGLTAVEMIRRLIAAADAFAAGARQHDDMTLSILRVLPPRGNDIDAK